MVDAIQLYPLRGAGYGAGGRQFSDFLLFGVSRGQAAVVWHDDRWSDGGWADVTVGPGGSGGDIRGFSIGGTDFREYYILQYSNKKMKMMNEIK